jgi:hypothetical protein
MMLVVRRRFSRTHDRDADVAVERVVRGTAVAPVEKLDAVHDVDIAHTTSGMETRANSDVARACASLSDRGLCIGVAKRDNRAKISRIEN